MANSFPLDMLYTSIRFLLVFIGLAGLGMDPTAAERCLSRLILLVERNLSPRCKLSRDRASTTSSCVFLNVIIT
jgi:hypothetical protein